MGLDDLVSSAKNALAGHEDQAKEALEKAAEQVKARTDAPDETVDKVVDAAKGFLDQQKKH